MPPRGSPPRAAGRRRERHAGAGGRRVFAYRRRIELGLLLLADMIVVAFYLLATLSERSGLPPSTIPFLAVVLALSLVPHLANRWLAPEADPMLLPLAALLNGIGYVMISRLDYHAASLQAVWTAVGVAAYVTTLFVVRSSIDLSRYRYMLGFASVALLATPLLPVIGLDIGGARMWVHLGSFTFQPVDLAKIGLCIFFAAYLVEKGDLLSTGSQRVGNWLIPDLRSLAPVVLAWGFAMLLIAAERDVGFALLIFLLFLAMLWVETGRVGYLLIGVVMFVLGAIVAGHFLPQVHERITVWLDPWKYAQTIGYQLAQAQYAMGTGGLIGTGIGHMDNIYIPVVTSDFIFAAIGEQLGLLGTSTIMFAYVLMVGAGLRIAMTARHQFAKLTAVGLSTILGLQSFFIMAGVTRLLPVTGITLPFVAYGGSSLLANYILLAVLMRISNETEHPAVLAARALLEGKGPLADQPDEEARPPRVMVPG